MAKMYKRAFSLIELLVVIAITGILAAIAVPSYQQYQIRAKVSRGYVLMNALLDALKVTYVKTGSYPSSFVYKDGSVINAGTWNNVNANDPITINIGYVTAAKGVWLGFTLKGLDNLPGLGSTSGTTINAGLYDTGSVIKYACGQSQGNWAPDPYTVPQAYQPPNCTCGAIYTWMVNGSVC